MYTPSGRFQPDKKICFSMSDFHPGSVRPSLSPNTLAIDTDCVELPLVESRMECCYDVRSLFFDIYPSDDPPSHSITLHHTLILISLCLFFQIDWFCVFYAFGRDDHRLRDDFGCRQKSVCKPESCLEFATKEVQGGLSRGEYTCSRCNQGYVPPA